MATRQNWIEANGGLTGAVELEDRILSIGSEFLPQCAIDVRDKRVAEPGPEYWDFLLDQLAKMS